MLLLRLRRGLVGAAIRVNNEMDRRAIDLKKVEAKPGVDKREDFDPRIKPVDVGVGLFPRASSPWMVRPSASTERWNTFQFTDRNSTRPPVASSRTAMTFCRTMLEKCGGGSVEQRAAATSSGQQQQQAAANPPERSPSGAHDGPPILIARAGGAHLPVGGIQNAYAAFTLQALQPFEQQGADPLLQQDLLDPGGHGRQGGGSPSLELGNQGFVVIVRDLRRGDAYAGAKARLNK